MRWLLKKRHEPIPLFPVGVLAGGELFFQWILRNLDAQEFASISITIFIIVFKSVPLPKLISQVLNGLFIITVVYTSIPLLYPKSVRNEISQPKNRVAATMFSATILLLLAIYPRFVLIVEELLPINPAKSKINLLIFLLPISIVVYLSVISLPYFVGRYVCRSDSLFDPSSIPSQLLKHFLTAEDYSEYSNKLGEYERETHSVIRFVLWDFPTPGSSEEDISFPIFIVGLIIIGPLVIIGLSVFILNLLFPLLEISVILASLFTYLTKKRSEDSLDWLRSDIENSIYDSITVVVSGSKGVVTFAICFIGFSVSAFICFSMGFLPPTPFFVWYWYRLLRRAPSFVAQWEQVFVEDARPSRQYVITRPKGYLISPTLTIAIYSIFVRLSWKYELNQSDHLFILLLFLIANVYVVWEAIKTLYSSPQPILSDQWAIPIGLVVQALGFIFAFHMLFIPENPMFTEFDYNTTFIAIYMWIFPLTLIGVLILILLFFFPDFANKVKGLDHYETYLSAYAILVFCVLFITGSFEQYIHWEIAILLKIGGTIGIIHFALSIIHNSF